MPQPWHTAIASGMVLCALVTAVEATNCTSVCVVNNASDAWDISDRAGCADLVTTGNIYNSAYGDSEAGRKCADHEYWSGSISRNSPVLTGTLRYCLRLVASELAGTIAFNLSRDEYANQPAAERQHFTIFVEQSPGFCEAYNSDLSLGHMDTSRSLDAKEPCLIDGDSQPDSTLDPDRDPALPKVFIRPKEALCWKQPDKAACNSTVYCNTCTSSDRYCYWDASNAARGFGGCKHSTPAALQYIMSNQTAEIAVEPTGCPGYDFQGPGFTLNAGLEITSAGVTVRGLGIVGFGRGNEDGRHCGLRLKVETTKHTANNCAGADGRVDGEVRVEGCYLAGNRPAGLVARNHPRNSSDPALPALVPVHVIVKSSELRRTVIEKNKKFGMWLLHVEYWDWRVRATVEDAAIGMNFGQSFNLSINPGDDFVQGVGIAIVDGSTVVVTGANISENGLNPRVGSRGGIVVVSQTGNTASTSLTVANSHFVGNPTDAIKIVAANPSTVRITNSTFEGGGGGVAVEPGARIVSISDSSFLGMVGVGVKTKSTATVARSRFENNGRAIFVERRAIGTEIGGSNFTGHTDREGTVLSQANGVRLMHCSFSDNIEGLKMYGNDTHISWTSIRDTVNTALWLEPEISDTTLVLAELSHVTLVNGGTGMQVAHALDLHIADSTVSGFTRSYTAGVALNHVANAALNNVTIESNAGGGLGLVSCTTSSISASLVINNTGDGVHVHSGSIGAALSSVTAQSNSGNGLLIDGPNATVTSVNASGNHKDGVHVSALAAGFQMSGTSTAPVTIENNAGSGIRVAAASVAITGAVNVGAAGKGNDAHGIFITETATDAIIGGGTATAAIVVAGNGLHGISVAGSGTVVSNCRIAGSGGAGIRLEVSATSAQIGRAGTFTAVGGAQGGPGIDVSAPDVAISSVTVGASVDTDTPVALPNCHAGIWLRAGASRATVADSSVAGADADCEDLGSCTVTANRGYGVVVDAVDAAIVGCRVGVGGHHDDVDIGNDAGGIFLSATNGTITHTLVGNNGGHGVTVAAGAEESVRVQHNTIGDCHGRNCSNRGHGIFFEADMDPATIAERMNNNTIGFNGRAGLRVGQSSLAEARADLANTVSSTTNSWMFFNACDLCECTMYCYDATGANASACRPGQLPHNFSEVDCSSLDLGPDFPERFPARVTGFTMQHAGARRVELSAVAATVTAVDLQGNPKLDASTAIRSVELPMLRYLDLDGTIQGVDLADAVRGLKGKDRLEFLSVADASAGSTSGLVLDLAGFASLGAMLWSNASTCPVGFYDTASVGAGATAGKTGLCVRCPVNTYQPVPGKIGRDSCIPCADGTYDYDQDPTTECENSLFSLNATVWPNTTVNAVVTGRGLRFPVCSEPCIHDRYEINYSYTLRLDPVQYMFNNGHGLDAVAFSTFIYYAGPAGGCSVDGPFGPMLTPDQAAVSVDSRDGITSFKPMTTGRRFIAVMDATDVSSGATITVRRWCFDVLESDLDVPDSINGSVCVNGDRVEDQFQLNRNYTCRCFLDVDGTALWQGRNCNQANVDSVIASAHDPGSDSLVMAVALAVTLTICCVIIARLRYKIYLERKIENTPVDFAARLSVLEDQGLIRSSLGGGGAGDGDGDGDEEEGFHQPVELKRKAIDLIDTLGAGAFGEVMKGVYNPPDGKTPEFTVAVKVLKGEPSNDEREELLKEAVITAQFNHPNVVGLVGVVTSGSPYMLVLQFCEGGALQSILKKKKDDIPGKDLLGYCLGICKGMHYLSSKHFVHRDLATRNVLLDARRAPKVADFGLSRDMESADYYTAGETAKMPIRWSAPECISQQKFSEKSDVWAAGVTMVETYTRGETPYRGWINSYVVEQVLDGFTLPVPMECPDKVFSDCIAPCFEFEKEHRPTFSFLVERLDLYMRNYAQLTVATVEDRTRRLSVSVLKVLPGSMNPPTISEVAAADEEDQYEDFGATDEAPTSLFVGFGQGGSTMVKDLSKKKMAAFSNSSKSAELATMMMLEEQRALAEVRQQSVLRKESAANDLDSSLSSVATTEVDGSSGYTGQHRIDPRHRIPSVPSRQNSTDHLTGAWEDGETFSSAAVFSNGDAGQAIPEGPAVAARNAPLPAVPRDQRADLLAWHEEHSMSNATVGESPELLGPDTKVKSDTLQRRLSKRAKGKGKNATNELYVPTNKYEEMSHAPAAAFGFGGNVGMVPVPGFELEDLGRRVKLTSSALTGTGVLRFVGLHKQKGVPRVGIEMDEAVGLNDGALNDGVDRYFECAPNYGVFANPGKVRFASKRSIDLLGMGDGVNGAEEGEVDEDFDFSI